MLQLLKNYNTMSDGSVFKKFTVVPDSVIRLGDARGQMHNWKGLLRIYLTYKRVRLQKSKTYVVVHNTYTGYFHWMLESLPRILIAKAQLPAFTLLLPDNFTDDFYQDSLALLGLDIAQAQPLHPRTVYQVPNLGLTCLPDSMGSFTPSIVANLKQALLTSPALKPASRPLPQAERLYISRKKAPRRKIVNEPAVEQMLARHGFESICFEDYTLHEQIIICSTCRFFISIHGAGLSNILFMPAGSTVIELRKYDANKNYTYERLAIALGHIYKLAYFPAVDESLLVQDADLMVDSNELEVVLQDYNL